MDFENIFTCYDYIKVRLSTFKNLEQVALDKKVLDITKFNKECHIDYKFRWLNDYYSTMSKKSFLYNTSIVNSRAKHLSDKFDAFEGSIVSSTYIFSEDKALIEFLISRGLTFEKLIKYQKLIFHLKKAEAKNEDSVNAIIKLCKLIQTYFGEIEYKDILNKIAILLVFKKRIFMELESCKEKTR